MKKLIYLILVGLLLSSCGTTYRVSGRGCGVWYPKRFERDRGYDRNWNWVKNPNSPRYRGGVHE